MGWRQFIMNLGTLDADEVERILVAHGAQAITYTDAGDDPVLEPLPGQTPLWSKSCITGLFTEATDFEPLTTGLAAAFGLDSLPCWRIEPLEDRVWEREWLKEFRPMRFGRRLWVCPEGFEPPDEDAVSIRLDPGLAFGTGTHPTTALCLERLDSLFDREPSNEKRVLDFGCGSGILAIGAVKLGAREAVAVDIDPQAVAAARRNAARNEVEDRICVTLDDADPGTGYDVVIANILAKPLIELAQPLAERLNGGGTLVLSGILESQIRAVLAAYTPAVNFGEPVVRDGWACLCGRRD